MINIAVITTFRLAIWSSFRWKKVEGKLRILTSVSSNFTRSPHLWQSQTENVRSCWEKNELTRGGAVRGFRSGRGWGAAFYASGFWNFQSRYSAWSTIKKTFFISKLLWFITDDICRVYGICLAHVPRLCNWQLVEWRACKVIVVTKNFYLRWVMAHKESSTI